MFVKSSAFGGAKLGFPVFFSPPRSGISIDVLTELFIANQQFYIRRFAPSSGNMHTSEVLLDLPKNYRFLKDKDIRFWSSIS